MKRCLLLIIAGALAAVCSPALADAANRAEQVSMGKRATALVGVDAQRGFGTAFCISKKGYFITNNRVVSRARERLLLVLNPGGRDERKLPVEVVRIDKEHDLALLWVKEAGKLTALPLGSDAELIETDEVTAFGYPHGRAEQSPEITVNVGRIAALRRSDGKLRLIQLDAELNPGNSGGPVLDRQGRVIGVVVAQVAGSGTSFAIPVRLVREFLLKPAITFDPARIPAARRHAPLAVTAGIRRFLNGEPFQVFLEWTPPGADSRRVELQKTKDDTYAATVVLVPKSREGSRVKVTAEFSEGLLQGRLGAIDIKLDGESIPLTDVQEIRRRDGRITVTRKDGTERSVKTLGGLPNRVRMGELALKVDLTQARRLVFQEADSTGGPIRYAVIVEEQGREIARTEGQILEEIETPAVAAGEMFSLGGQSPWPGFLTITDNVVRGQDGLTMNGRKYVATEASDFLTKDFTFEIGYTLGPNQDSKRQKTQGMTFIGLGTLDRRGADEPSNAVFWRIHPPDVDNGSVGLSKHAGTSGIFAGHVRKAGTHLARIQKRGHLVSFTIDVDSDGPSTGDLAQTIPDIREFAPFLNDKNTYLFFGGGATFTKTRLIIANEAKSGGHRPE